MSLLRIVDLEGNPLLEITLTINWEYKERSITHRLNHQNNFERDEFREVTKFYDNDMILKQMLLVYYVSGDDWTRDQ